MAAHADPATTGSANHHTGGPRPDGHAPISIMGEHTHGKGEWMLSYRLMQMEMDGMRKGTDGLSSSEVFSAGPGHVVCPEDMTMYMHMLGAMHAPGDRLTLMLMANYLDSEMDHRINPAAGMMIRANGGADTFSTRTSGIGDTRVSALYKFHDKGGLSAHLGLGLSLPTGSIDKKDDIPVMGMGRVRSVLPAPMQLGSGTFDLLPSLTLRREAASWSCGLQAGGVLRLQDENDRDYRLGHQFRLTGWAGLPLAEWISLGGGLEYQWSGELEGDQRDISQGPAMMGRNTVTTAYGENYGGERVEAILGVNLLGPSGAWQGHRLAIDLRLPLYQDLNGYQLETDHVFTLGWQKAW